MSWKKNDENLEKQFVFKNQTELAEAVLVLARHSDEIGHHADLQIHYNRLDVSITTHDAGRLTEKDYTLAKVIDGLFES
ncbi:4a-hydroxytetrahydrobiopterin dehydratase [Crocinitomicaceae bacterium]|nr:4a-hydroxytetrahydrobiopterin dehydratase [Crocinitomicaceae bacterium]